MASSLSSKPLQTKLLFSTTTRSHCPSLCGFKALSFRHFCALSSPKHALLQGLPPFSTSKSHADKVADRMAQREVTHERKGKDERIDDGLVGREETVEFRGRQLRKEPKDRGFRRNREMGSSGLSSLRSGDEIHGRKPKKIGTLGQTERKIEGKIVKKRNKKDKDNTAEIELRVGLDMCSKKGDVMGAISLFDSAIKGSIKLEQYHYNVLLYLCSSAAVGVVHPGKSGTGGAGSSSSSPSVKESSVNELSMKDSQVNIDGVVTKAQHFHSINLKERMHKETYLSEQKGDDDGIPISDEVRDYARTRGFEIFEKMFMEKVPMSEAALTSVARMAMAMNNGDMAFEIVKHMKELGITRRLRSYGPALMTFCNNGDVNKAFEVEAHMLESGVYPEEPELEALLRASVAACRGEKVYYLLHKLRTSVRQVSPSIADLIETWFRSSTASKVGKRRWDENTVAQAIENGGGGWHGLGWLGRGKWTLARTTVDADGVCLACGEKLVTIDLDPIDTENFAISVASIASKRERNSSFQKFQKWLDYYGPFEAVVDAANVGLFSQRRFSLSKVNAVVNGIRQKLPSKKWPLIVVHNRRLSGDKMEEPKNSKLIEKWKNADAIYATPTGSNDDWYWLYAAIKCKCLVVTNDEMRDHIFQLLGNDLFPKWKERHQVRFSFQDGGFELQMPPPCSVVVQESKEGHWHIPIKSECEVERERTWLCLTRANSRTTPREGENHTNSFTTTNETSVVEMDSVRHSHLFCQDEALNI